MSMVINALAHQQAIFLFIFLTSLESHLTAQLKVPQFCSA